MRTFDPVVVDPIAVIPATIDPVTFIGRCRAWCWREETPLAGLLNGETLCVHCHEDSKSRVFYIYMRGGDILCSNLDSIESAMAEIATYLEEPAVYGPYFPIKVTAEHRVFNLSEVVATISMPGEGVLSRPFTLAEFKKLERRFLDAYIEEMKGRDKEDES